MEGNKWDVGGVGKGGKDLIVRKRRKIRETKPTKTHLYKDVIFVLHPNLLHVGNKSWYGEPGAQ